MSLQSGRLKKLQLTPGWGALRPLSESKKTSPISSQKSLKIELKSSGLMHRLWLRAPGLGDAGSETISFAKSVQILQFQD